MRTHAAAVIAVALMLTSCGSPAATPSSPTATPPSSSPSSAPSDGVKVLGAGLERVESAATEQDVAALTDAQTAFAIDLYHAVRSEVDDDLVVGPTSLHTVLAMVREGARGRTAAEMDAVLHASDVELHASGNALDRALRARNDAEGIDLATANRLWVQDGLELAEDYVATIAGNYGAGLATADFMADPDAARAIINQWAAKATRDMIDELFPDGTLSRNTRLVLVNALFLDAAWKFPFDPEHTSDEVFTLADGSFVTVPTMHYDQYLPSATGTDWAAVELPYDGEQLSMTVIVPEVLAEFERRLDPDLLSEVLGQITDGGIHLSLPRFTARTHLSLAETLADMGMPTAFSGAADFSGMTGGPGLFIGDVEHEAVVEVDEAGTQAAAASGAEMLGSHGPTVSVDRPFLFLIRDEQTGAVLFLGRVADPR